ncbi:MAG: type II secretion system F family protein [Candidatus Binataceae bacterium]
MTLLITMTFAFLMAAAGVALYGALFGSARVMEERLNDLAVKIRVSGGALDEHDESLGRMLLMWAVHTLPPPKLDSPKGEKLMQTLIQAGYLKSAAPAIFHVIRIACALLFGLVGFVVGIFIGAGFSTGMVYALGAAAVGSVAPSYYVGSRGRKRQGAISRELSDVLDLLVVCVEAGLGLYEAIKIVGGEAERHGQVIGRELSLVASEVSSGGSLGQALRNLANRTAVEDIKPLAATLIQSEQLGAQIAPALRASSDALRSRRRLRAEEAAQKTTVKIMFPLVVFVLPAMLMVIAGPAVIQIINTLGH